MVSVTTVALLERKPGITRSLFSRYWRDVHGVMAARIPGFESYTQYHVTPVAGADGSRTEPFEGIAVVTFANEADRQGLGSSEITKHIHRDEQNVFQRALLYNLDADARRIRVASVVTQSGIGHFLLLPAGSASFDQVVSELGAEGLRELHTYDLTSGDPSAWNNTDVGDGADRRNVGLVRASWDSPAAADRALQRLAAAFGTSIPIFQIDDTFVMVDAGKPTAIGLRGLDAVKTIEEAGAQNQLDAAVVSAIYGI